MKKGIAILLLLLGVTIAMSGSARAQRAEADETRKQGFGAFELILTRNIFDPQRRPSRGEAEAVATPTPTPLAVPETIDLIGVWLTDRQALAFTQGSLTDYTGALGVGEKIAGWRIAAIEIGHVRIEKEDENLAWPVGRRLERRAGDAWELTGEAAPAAGPASSSPAASSSSSDLLKKMRERRQRETR